MREEFIALSVRRGIQKNQFIFCEGERGDSAFYVESGKVKTFRIASCAKECIFFIRGPGEIFGISELLGLNMRKADAQSLSDCFLYEIRKDEFEFLLCRHATFARRVMEEQAKRIRYLCDHVENLMAFDLSKRLLKLFIHLSYRQINDSLLLDESVTVPVKLTQEEIASLTGSCQQTISETLKELKKKGFIKIYGKEITLIRPIRILKYCEMIE